MCGIAGFLGFEDGIFLAERANEIQKSRGPDHQGVWSHDGISLASQRLSIIDLSEQANQPFIKSPFVLAFNGEIYNYRYVREELEKHHSIVFHTHCDTEVVLEAYRVWGDDCVNHFRGMFSFAIYNQDKKNIYIARDFFGIKPLFYTYKEGTYFAFASQIDSLLQIKNVSKGINYSSLVSNLHYLWIAGNETIFENIYQLPPAHYVNIDRNLHKTQKKYYNFLEKTNTTSLPSKESDIVDLLTHTFKESMDRHLVSDVPVSTFLSGGLDSSLISVLAKMKNKTLSAYTIGMRNRDRKIEKMGDDMYYARKISKQYSIESHEIFLEPKMIDVLPKIVDLLGQPHGDPAIINTYLICQYARQRGVKVLLSGMGADEIFFGYRRQIAVLYAHIYHKFPKLFRSLLQTTLKHIPIKLFGMGLRKIRWAKRFSTFADCPKHELPMRSMSYFTQQDLKKLLCKDIYQEFQKMSHYFNSCYEEYNQKDLINKLCATDIQMFMTDHNLAYTDRASMAHSVEVRVPFVDRDLIELGMSIPGNWKFHKNESKYILKKMAESFLPKEIIYREKTPFAAPIRSWLSHELAALVDDLLSESNLKKIGYFQPDFVSKLIKEDRKGVEDHSLKIYQLLTLQLWLEKNHV